MIPVTHEDVEALKKWGMGLEHILEKCVFCGECTRYWHVPKNCPVCEDCAQSRSVNDLSKKE